MVRNDSFLSLFLLVFVFVFGFFCLFLRFIVPRSSSWTVLTCRRNAWFYYAEDALQLWTDRMRVTHFWQIPLTHFELAIWQITVLADLVPATLTKYSANPLRVRLCPNKAWQQMSLPPRWPRIPRLEVLRSKNEEREDKLSNGPSASTWTCSFSSAWDNIIVLFWVPSEWFWHKRVNDWPSTEL